MEPGAADRIVVTGLGIVCAIGNDAREYLDGLRAGRCGIGPVRHLDTRWTACTIGGEVDDFEPRLTRIGARELTRAEQLAVNAASEALDQSNLDATALAERRVGVSIGTCQSAVSELADQDSPRSLESIRVGSAADAVAAVFRCRGPRLVASNACAAGAAAIAMARDQLWRGAADVMLAGGADALEFFTHAGFSVLQSLDLEPCAPYSRSGGLSLGEGAAVLVLERLDDAQARGAPILAELAGCGSSADGYHPTAPDPTGRGAALAMERALAQAGIDPSQVDYVNGHGTGTHANDTMERAAFRLVFGDRATSLPTSSTKSLLGHTLGAAGAVEAVACILAIRHGFLPPTANVPAGFTPDWDIVPNTSRPAEVSTVVSNNYAFGGSNASLVFTGPDRPAPNPPPPASEPVLVTGLGPVGALGEGVEAWWGAFDEGRTGIGPIRGFDASRYCTSLAAEAPPLDPKRYASRQDWRKMNGFARLCVAAARLAWLDADLRPTRDELAQLALVFATGTGALADTVTFDTLARRGPDQANPNLFPHVALNAAGGHVCTVLGIHGPTLSITQAGLSSLAALEYAGDLVRRGEVAAAIVVAGDEFSETMLEAIDRFAPHTVTATGARPFSADADGFAPGTAAVAVVLESASHAAARGARAYAELLGSAMVGATATTLDEVDPADWIEAIELATSRSGLRPDEIGYCAAAASGSPEADALERTALDKALGAGALVSAPKSMTGECFGSTAAIGLLAAISALHRGVVPPTVGSRPDPGVLDGRHVVGTSRPADVAHALVSAAIPGLGYGALVLGRAP